MDMPTKEALESSREVWFSLLVGSAATVAVGVALEAADILHDIRKALSDLTSSKFPRLFMWLCPKHTEASSWAKLLGAVGWLLIVAGVVGEVYFESRVNEVDKQLGVINDKALADSTLKASANANEAAHLNKLAEDLKLDTEKLRNANVGLQIQLAELQARASDRHIGSGHRGAFIRGIKACMNERVDVSAKPEDSEAKLLGEEIFDIFVRDANFVVATFKASPTWDQFPNVRGVVVVGPEMESKAKACARSLESALRVSEIEVKFKADPKLKDSALILIGSKPKYTPPAATKQ